MARTKTNTQNSTKTRRTPSVNKVNVDDVNTFSVGISVESLLFKWTAVDIHRKKAMINKVTCVHT